VTVFEVGTGKELFQITEGPLRACFVPDGKLAAGGKLWDVSSRRPLRDLEGIMKGRPVAFHPDGRSVVTGHFDRIRLLDRDTGALLSESGVLAGGSHWITSIGFSPDGRHIHAARGMSVSLMTAEVSNEPGTLLTSEGVPTLDHAPAFSPDGKLFAITRKAGFEAGGQQCLVELWDTATGARQHTLSSGSEVSFSSDGRLLATADMSSNALGAQGNQDVHIWDTSTWTKARTLRGMSPLIFSPDGRYLAAAKNSRQGVVWDLSTGRAIQEPPGMPRLFGAGTNLLVSDLRNRQNELVLWDVEKGKQRWRFNAPMFMSAQFSPDDRFLAVVTRYVEPKVAGVSSAGGQKGGFELTVWDVSTGERRFAAKGRAGYSGLPSVGSRPDGTLLLFAGDVIQWHPEKGVRTLEWQKRSRYHTPLCLSPDGRLLAAIENYRVLELWKVEGWECLGTLPRPPYSPTVPSSGRFWFSPDSRLLAGTGVVWDAVAGMLLEGVRITERRSVFSQDGRLCGTVSPESSMLWDVSQTDGQMTAPLRLCLTCPEPAQPLAATHQAARGFAAFYADAVRMADLASKGQTEHLEHVVRENPAYARMFVQEMLRECVHHQPISRRKLALADALAKLCDEAAGNRVLTDMVERVSGLRGDAVREQRGLTFLGAAHAFASEDERVIKDLVSMSPAYAGLFVAECVIREWSRALYPLSPGTPRSLKALDDPQVRPVALAKRVAKVFEECHGSTWLTAAAKMGERPEIEDDPDYVRAGVAVVVGAMKRVSPFAASDLAGLREFVKTSLRMGRYESALLRANNNMAIAGKFGDDGAEAHAKSDVHLATLYSKLPAEAQADEKWAKAAGSLAVRRFEDGRASDVIDDIAPLRKMVQADLMVGDFGQGLATAGWNQALVEAIGSDRANVLARLDVGDVHRRIGDYGKAMAAVGLADSIVIDRQVSGMRHQVLAAKARVLQSQGKKREARELVKQAVEIAQEAGDRAAECSHRTVLALALIAAGAPEDARKEARLADDIANELDLPSERVAALYALASSYAATGDYRQAIKLYGESVATEDKAGIVGWRWECLCGIGSCHERLAALPGTNKSKRTLSLMTALTMYAKALEAVEKLRGALVQEEHKAFFSGDKSELYESLVRVCLARGRDRDAAAYVERCKGAAFLERFSPRALERRRERLEARKARVDKTLEGAKAGEPIPQDLRDLAVRTLGRWPRTPKAQLAALRGVGRACSSGIGRLGGSAHTKGRNLSQLVARMLTPKSIVLEYFLGKKLVCGISLHRRGIRALSLEAKQGDLAAAIDEFRGKAVESLSEAKLRDESYREPLRRLYAMLVEPFEAELAGADTVYIVPHGVLHYLPFQALIDSEDRYLIEKVNVAYTPSLSVLRHCREANMDNKGSLLAVANPDTGWDELPATEREAAAVAKLFQDKAEVVMGAKATERVVKDKAGEFDVLTFPTHGEMVWQDPTKSNLRFTPGGGEDGRWTVHEIFDMDLKASLVTLSACETGLAGGYSGKLPEADDFVGLTRAFMYAGVPSVVGSLWKVADDSAVTLMTAFFTNWKQKGMDKAEALRQAQLAMINGDLELGMVVRGPGGVAQVNAQEVQTESDISLGRHPYFWAPFVLIGDYR